MRKGEWGEMIGIIRLIEENDKGGITLRVSVDHSKGGSHGRYLNVYGAAANDFKPGRNGEPPKLKTGDMIAAEWEVIDKPNLNKQTGKTEGWISYKTNYTFDLLQPAEALAGAGGARRNAPAYNAPQQQGSQASNTPQAGAAVDDDNDDW